MSSTRLLWGDKNLLLDSSKKEALKLCTTIVTERVLHSSLMLSITALSVVTHDTDGVKTPIRCQRVSIKVPCRDICPQAHTQCWHPSFTTNPADCLPAGPLSINNGHHPSFPVGTANNVLSITGQGGWQVHKLICHQTRSLLNSKPSAHLHPAPIMSSWRNHQKPYCHHSYMEVTRISEGASALLGC